MIKKSTKTTINTPTQTPASKTAPINSQPVKVNRRNVNMNICESLILFITNPLVFRSI